MAKYDGLGYEQLLALRLMRDKPNMELSIIAKEVDCSWDELIALTKIGLAESGLNRIHEKEVHPIITDAGLAILADAETDDII